MSHEEENELHDLFESPCHVRKINLRGLQKTSKKFIQREIGPIYAVKTVKELTERVYEATESLRGLDLFSEVLVTVDAGPDDSPDSCLVNVEFVEKSNYTAKIGTYAQGGEGSVELAATMRNLGGTAQKLETNVTFGSQASSACRINYTNPRFGDGSSRFELSAFKSIQNNLRHSAHFEYQHGVLAAVLANRHKFGYELAWRNVCGIPANHPIAAFSGHSLKSAFSHSFTVDERDDPRGATEGFYLNTTNELAGFGGDVKLFKSLNKISIHLPIISSMTLSLSTLGGFILPLTSAAPTISDRFFLGGAPQLRGFRTKGVGPRAKNANEFLPDGATGGDVMVAASATLSFQPAARFFQILGLRAHVFGTVGNNAMLLSSRGGASLSSSLGKFVSEMRGAWGIGISSSLAFGQVEANYCFPLRWFPGAGDRVRRGFQLGIDFA